MIVIVPPRFNRLSRIRETGKPMLIQAFVTKLAIETLDIRILDRLPRVKNV
jgi:hypothetical protein